MKFLFISFFLLFTNVLQSAPLFGRYVGVFRHEAIKKEQLAKLDFIPSREEGNIVILKAILTLHFGDFKSGEYVAYHFDSVRFNILTRAFVFDQADQSVTLVGKLTSDSKFEGEFRSVYSGDIGKVTLSSSGEVKPKISLIEPVWGEYRGKCENKSGDGNIETIVQLYTYRSNEGATQIGNPFRAYKIKGFVGIYDENGCLFSTQKECVGGNVKSGAYNFFKNQIFIYNNYKNLSCRVGVDGLECDGCETLKKVSLEKASPTHFLPPPSSNTFDISKPPASPAAQAGISSIQGEYKGYLHHEYLDQYQLGSLSILTYQASDENSPVSLRMSVVGTLYFGDGRSGESLSYRFKERPYPSPLTAPQFVFSQTEGDVDAILQVTYFGKGVVKGIWFSRLFGRVGTFEFRKEGLLPLPEKAKVMEPISAFYESTQWELNLLTELGTAPTNTENPFAPLTFNGWTLMNSITPKIAIKGGSFDFYTGKIGIEFNDNDVHVGNRISRKKLMLKKLNYGLMTPLPPHELQPYRMLSEKED